MQTGLTELDLRRLTTAISHFSEIERTVIFGSRAKGTYKKASNVDLAIKGSAVTPEIVQRLNFLLNEELPLPYFFDVVHYESLDNQSLIQHIDSVGKSMPLSCDAIS